MVNCPNCGVPNMVLQDHGNKKQFLSWVCEACGYINNPYANVEPEKDEQTSMDLAQDIVEQHPQAQANVQLPVPPNTAPQFAHGGWCQTHNKPQPCPACGASVAGPVYQP